MLPRWTSASHIFVSSNVPTIHALHEESRVQIYVPFESARL